MKKVYIHNLHEINKLLQDMVDSSKEPSISLSGIKLAIEPYLPWDLYKIIMNHSLLLGRYILADYKNNSHIASMITTIMSSIAETEDGTPFKKIFKNRKVIIQKDNIFAGITIRAAEHHIRYLFIRSTASWAEFDDHGDVEIDFLSDIYKKDLLFLYWLIANSGKKEMCFYSDNLGWSVRACEGRED